MPRCFPRLKRGASLIHPEEKTTPYTDNADGFVFVFLVRICTRVGGLGGRPSSSLVT